MPSQKLCVCVFFVCVASTIIYIYICTVGHRGRASEWHCAAVSLLVVLALGFLLLGFELLGFLLLGFLPLGFGLVGFRLLGFWLFVAVGSFLDPVLLQVAGLSVYAACSGQCLLLLVVGRKEGRKEGNKEGRKEGAIPTLGAYILEGHSEGAFAEPTFCRSPQAG